MNIEEQINVQLQAGFNLDEVRQTLRSKGYSNEDITAAFESYQMEEMNEFSSKHPILTNKYLPAVLIILTYILFFHLIPASVAGEHTIMFAIIGGVLMLIFSLWTFAKLTPFLIKKFPICMGLLSVMSLFVFGFFFIKKTTNFRSNELRENGIVTTARIVDMSQISGRGRHKMSTITVLFQSKEYVNLEAEIDVIESEYENMNEGMRIPILYSSKNPAVAVIAYPKTLQQYGK